MHFRHFWFDRFALVFFLTVFGTGCGSGAAPAAAPVQQAQIDYSGAPADFAGTYRGDLTLFGNRGVLTVHIEQSPDQLDLVRITVEAGTIQREVELPNHRIVGNDLYDTVSDGAKVGQIGASAFRIAREEVGEVVFRRAPGGAEVTVVEKSSGIRIDAFVKPVSE